jgi:hypothetical protein
MKNGRPSILTEELSEAILSRIAEGESVRSIALDDTMPNASTIHRWVFSDEEGFCKRYEDAKTIGLEIRAEEIEYIAETMEDLQRAKLVTDVKKWNMSKVAPKRFGDKIDMTSAGNAIQPVLVEIIGKDEKDNTDTNGV